jgi:hypothetical protein
LLGDFFRFFSGLGTAERRQAGWRARLTVRPAWRLKLIGA